MIGNTLKFHGKIGIDLLLILFDNVVPNLKGSIRLGAGGINPDFFLGLIR